MNITRTVHVCLSCQTCVSLFSEDKRCPIIVRFLQSMDLTGFSDQRGSAPAWTLNALAHARRFDKDFSFVSHFGKRVLQFCIYTMPISRWILYFSVDGKRRRSFDRLITYFANYDTANTIRYENGHAANTAVKLLVDLGRGNVDKIPRNGKVCRVYR